MRFPPACVIVLLALAAGCGSDRPPPATVEALDLDRYAGRWYEIAKLPNDFQDDCAGDTTATYTIRDDGRIDVENRCRTAEGGVETAHGVARLANGDPARLEVSFFDIFGWRPVWGEYWVIGLDRNYEWAVVGHPRREYGWILARTPRLTDTGRDRIDRLLRDAGYDPARFIETPHHN